MLAAQNVADMIITNYLTTGDVLPYNVREGGTGATGETQRVQLASAASGEFSLTLNYNGTAYTTSGLAFNANNTTVQTALNTALSGLTNANTTVSGAVGDWQVTFGGS